MMTYIGAAHLKEVSKRTTFVRVSAQTNDVFGDERLRRKAAAQRNASTLHGDLEFRPASIAGQSRRAFSRSQRKASPIAEREAEPPRRGAKQTGQPRLGSVERNHRQLQRIDQPVDFRLVYFRLDELADDFGIVDRADFRRRQCARDALAPSSSWSRQRSADASRM